MFTHFRHHVIKILFAAFLLLVSVYPAASAPLTMESAFRAQDWKSMDALYAAADATSRDLFPKKLSLLDRSLYLNGLWRRGMYAEAAAQIEAIESDGEKLPDGVAPYAQMMKMLALERTDRKAEALELGTKLWDGAPEPMRYYLAYAMARAARDTGRSDEAAEWFRRMLAVAADKKARLRALVPLSELPSATADEIGALLVDSPSNSRALAASKSIPKGSSKALEYALGRIAYNAKKYDTAIAHLKAASTDGTFGEAARYFLGYSAFRKGDYATALSAWSRVALEGNEYPQRSVARMITLAGKSKRAEVAATLRRVGESRSDYPELAADALAGLVKIGSEADASWARKKLLSEYGSTDRAATLAWEDGWAKWKAKSYREAAEIWSRVNVSSLRSRELGARITYWRSRALDQIKDADGARRLRAELSANFPAEYYTFLVDPSGGITNADISDDITAPSELERWGFITYARIEAAGAAASGDVAAMYRASRLAAWEGDYPTSVRSASGLLRALPSRSASSSKLLRLSFPRAYERDVDAASKKTGLDKAYIWGIMRQESMYEADVTSSAGAYGLMQLMPATAKGEEKKMKMAAGSYKTPAHNIMLGANHFVGLMAAFKGSAELSLAAYNAGGGRVRQWTKEGVGDIPTWVENIPFNETRGYVKACMRNYWTYKKIWDEKK